MAWLINIKGTQLIYGGDEAYGENKGIFMRCQLYKLRLFSFPELSQ